jgi:hypothetical protein
MMDRKVTYPIRWSKDRNGRETMLAGGGINDITVYSLYARSSYPESWVIDTDSCVTRIYSAFVSGKGGFMRSDRLFRNCRFSNMLADINAARLEGGKDACLIYSINEGPDYFWGGSWNGNLKFGSNSIIYNCGTNFSGRDDGKTAGFSTLSSTERSPKLYSLSRVERIKVPVKPGTKQIKVKFADYAVCGADNYKELITPGFDCGSFWISEKDAEGMTIEFTKAAIDKDSNFAALIRFPNENAGEWKVVASTEKPPGQRDAGIVVSAVSDRNEEKGEDKPVYLNFDNSEKLDSAWTIHNLADGQSVSIDNEHSNSPPNSLLLKSGGKRFNGATFEFPAQNGNGTGMVTVSFRYLLNKKRDKNEHTYIFIYGDAGKKVVEGPVVSMRGNLYWIRDGGGWLPFKRALTRGSFAEIRMELDLNEDNFAFYVNGRKAGVYRFSRKSDIDNIKKIRFAGGYTKSSVTHVNIDDIKIEPAAGK